MTSAPFDEHRDTTGSSTGRAPNQTRLRVLRSEHTAFATERLRLQYSGNGDR